MITIRAANRQDRARLAVIYFEVRKAAFTWAPPNLFKLEDFETDTVGETIFVANQGDRIMGFVSLYEKDKFIHHLFVDPRYQKSGLGSLLLDRAVKALGLPVRLKCVLLNTQGCEFYQRRGWKIESTTNDGLVDPYHTFILL